MRKTIYHFKILQGRELVFKSLPYFLLVVVMNLMISCETNVQPKPSGFLALEYPEASYDAIALDCPYQFRKNSEAIILDAEGANPCWINLDYPRMKGTIFITYQQVQDNLDSLLRDAQKLPLQHTIKADGIEGDMYVNEYNRTYGMIYEISGNAASQAQFYLTDSTKHFLTGSIYFNVEPNFDSILPAADYLKQDIRHLMESLEWR